MEKYTLMLVDDEVEVIQTIIKKIDWDSIGFEVIGYASNGVKALEMMEESQPDVVMTDVKMPYMDGIELAKNIRAEYPETKILFFTGFDEFEYAREAVHLEVEEYILKPASAVELTEVFARVQKKLEQEVDDRRNVKTLEQYYMESLPLLQANFYTALIEGKVKEEELQKYLEDYRIQFAGSYFGCIIIHTSTSQVPDHMNPMLLTAAVQKMAQERLQENWKGKTFTYQGNLVMIVELEQEADSAELTNECDRFCRFAKRMVGAVVTIGISQVIDNILELPNAYRDAKEAVSYRAIFGVERAINIKEIVPKKKDEIEPTSDDALANLFKQIRLNAVDKIQGAVDEFFAHFLYEGKSMRQHQIAIMELVTSIYRFVENNEIEVEDVFPEIEPMYEKLIGMEPELLKNWLTNTSRLLCEQMSSSRTKFTNSYVARAKEYVKEHFGDENLSLDDICEYLGVSNAYFSTMFKKETGSSFVAYLTQYRMEQAAQLLMEGESKNYVIASRVGYADPNYFSYVFKRQFGVSPSKYGAEYAKNRE